jgi:hypothetical protein
VITHALTESAQVIILDTDSRWFGFRDDNEKKAADLNLHLKSKPYMRWAVLFDGPLA